VCCLRAGAEVGRIGFLPNAILNSIAGRICKNRKTWSNGQWTRIFESKFGAQPECFSGADIEKILNRIPGMQLD
jgi:hypothetical protein